MWTTTELETNKIWQKLQDYCHTVSHWKKQLKVTKQKIKDNTKNKHISMFFCLCISKTKAQATFKKWTCANKMGQMQNCAPLQHQLHVCLLIPNWLLPLHVSVCFCCCFWTNIAIYWSAFVVLKIWPIKSHTGWSIKKPKCVYRHTCLQRRGGVASSSVSPWRQMSGSRISQWGLGPGRRGNRSGPGLQALGPERALWAFGRSSLTYISQLFPLKLHTGMYQTAKGA